jgi:hypothetical protein
MDFPDIGLLGPLALAAELQRRNHVLTRWGEARNGFRGPLRDAWIEGTLPDPQGAQERHRSTLVWGARHHGPRRWVDLHATRHHPVDRLQPFRGR